jgi:imidazoleglycerol-phosphate dehydratase/histidinol-phosphatase
MRQAIEKRMTNETQIEIQLNLDGSGQSDIHISIGFFEHMLKQLPCMVCLMYP